MFANTVPSHIIWKSHISRFSFLQKQNLFVDRCSFQIQNAENSYILMYCTTMVLYDTPFYSIVCVNIL